MGAGAWALIGLAAVLAAGDWVAVATRNKRLEYLCKPATMLALIGAAAAIRPAVAAQQRWWLLALGLGLLGDVLLMLPRNLFAGGLGAFLVGHLAYIAGFRAAGASVFATLLWITPVLVVVAVALPPVLQGLLRRGRNALLAPIMVYALVISAMAASALASGSTVAAAGGLLFVVSDGLIAYRRFVTERPWMGLAIIITYHLGQGALVLSLAR
jgi:uncharacterized membrane protein YhhN